MREGAPRRAGHDWVSGRSHGAQVAQRGAPRPEAGSPGPRRGTEKTKPRRQREGRAALCVAAGQPAARHPAHGGQRGGGALRPLRSATGSRPASGGHRSVPLRRLSPHHRIASGSPSAPSGGFFHPLLQRAFLRAGSSPRGAPRAPPLFVEAKP